MKGFTLVEMLVALVVFGLLSAAGVSVLAYTADNRGVIRGRMDRLGEFQRARSLLKADFAQAAVRRIRDAEGLAARNAFAGNRLDSPGPLFGFVRRGWANPDAEPRASMQYVEYRLVDGQLERSARGALDGAAATAPQVLLAGIRHATVGYRYRGQWLDGWPGGADAMPEAVRLELELDGIGHVDQLFLLPGRGR
ncbi:MAG: type II secretion system minor pseudopilin GspJ [Lysobacter sp.]